MSNLRQSEQIAKSAPFCGLLPVWARQQRAFTLRNVPDACKFMCVVLTPSVRLSAVRNAHLSSCEVALCNLAHGV